MKRMASDTGQPPSERSRPGEEAVLLLNANQNSNDARKMELLERRLTAPPEGNDHSRTPSGTGFVARTDQLESPDSDDEVNGAAFGVVYSKRARRETFPEPPAVPQPPQRHPSGIPAPVTLNRSPSAANVPKSKGGNTISQYFQPVTLDRVGLGASSPGLPPREPAAAPHMQPQQQQAWPPAQDSRGARSPGVDVQQRLQQVQAKSLALSRDLAAAQEALRKSQAEARDAREAASTASRQAEEEAVQLRGKHSEEVKQYKSAVINLAKQTAEAERAERRRKVTQECARLGSVAVQRVGTVLQEVWEDGPSFRELAERLKAITSTREGVEAERKALKRRLAPPPSMAQTAPREPTEEYLKQDMYLLMEESLKVRIAALKKEEEAVQKDRERLERDKTKLLREIKRLRDEDASRFSKTAVLGGRYVLQYLLGRGGFSEVYKAFDSEELRFVACKIHQLSPQWSEDRKRSYVRHAAREYSIMKRMAHDSIVRLFDVFEIDDESFCTVLELCESSDLDAHLKSNGLLPEKEARAMIAQIFAGLQYLSQGQRPVIHYDLKPANILFDAVGRVKITDFGLSKIVEDPSGSMGVELTSQGAGTYWYLPPECFETGSTPRISGKVDVWSAGVIFYQMLYGRRPFGHDISQEKILREETILRGAKTVEFPPKPAVSAEAKQLIRRCLTYSQQERPDVATAAEDPYLSYVKMPKIGAAAASGGGGPAGASTSLLAQGQQ